MFMTASFNKQLFNILEKITGYNFDKRNIFWSERKQFERRNISIDLTVSPQLIKYCKESLHNVLSTNNFKKAIIYSNSAKSIKIIQEKIDLWLDGNETNINGDTMMINGDINAEQKFVNAKLFTKNLRDVSNNELNDLIYCPRILCAMSACIGAGLDSSQVYLVFRDGLPPSIIDFAQEMGRCGRRPLSTINLGHGDRNNVDMFYLVITIESYCYMLLRIYDTSDTLSDCEARLLERIITLNDRREMYRKTLHQLVSLVASVDKCWHYKFEAELLYNTFNGERETYDHVAMGCRSQCPYCQSISPLYKGAMYYLRVKKQGLIDF